MPNASLADFVTDWEKLLKNVTDAAAELPDLAVYKEPFTQLLASAKDMLARSQASKGLKQQETKDLQILMGQGKDAAAKLRSALKAHFGPKSERLVQFGMRPFRPRKKSDKAKAKAKNKKPEPEETPASASPSEATPIAS